MKCVRILIGAALVTLLVYMVGVDAVLDRLALLPLWFVPFGLLYYAVCQLISTKRWQILLRARGVEAGFWHLFRLYMIGMFANNFLPGAVGGDAVKAVGIYRQNRRGDVAVASVLVERFLGLAALGLLGLVASVPILIHRTTDWAILLATIGTASFITLAGFVVWFPPISGRFAALLGRYGHFRAGDLLFRMFDSTRIYWEQKGALLSAFLLSVLVQAMIGLYYLLAAVATGLDLQMIYFFAFLPAITLVSLLPISIGGLGVRELTMIFLFARVDVQSADILTIGLIIHALNTILSLAGAPILMRQRAASEAQAEKANP